MLEAIPGFDRYDRLLPELKLTLVLIGTLERSRREAEQNAKMLVMGAAGALVVAIFSLIVSLV
jgi:hypothetical protein